MPDTILFSFKKGKVRRVGDLKVPRRSSGIAKWNDKVFLFGGYNGSYMSEVEMYSIPEQSW
jgi:hypothetical protein